MKRRGVFSSHDVFISLHNLRGQTAVEFAFTLPIFLLFAFGTLDMAKALFTSLRLHDSTEAVKVSSEMSGDPNFVTCSSSKCYNLLDVVRNRIYKTLNAEGLPWQSPTTVNVVWRNRGDAVPGGSSSSSTVCGTSTCTITEIKEATRYQDLEATASTPVSFSLLGKKFGFLSTTANAKNTAYVAESPGFLTCTTVTDLNGTVLVPQTCV